MGLLSTIGAASGRAFGFTRSAIAAATDAFFNRVTLLLPGNGTNGAQNNTFLDSSSNNFTITRNGNTTQGTFSPFSQTGWGLRTNDRSYLTIPASGDFDLISTDFTVEFWFNLNAFNTMSGAGNNFFGNGLATATNGWGMSFAGSGTTATSIEFGVWNGGSYTTNSFTGLTLNMGVWYHIVLQRNGTGAGNLRLFVNGVLQGSAVNSVTYSTAGSTFTFGSGAYTQNGTYSGNADYFISNVRLTKAAVYSTSGFTSPTSNLSQISGTTLLICQSNRLINNGTNTGVITSSSWTSTFAQVVPFSPFLPTAAYSAATVGGSGYFDGTGDYLSVASNTAFQLGTGDWTVEYFVYPTTFSNSPTMVDTRASTGGNGYADYFNTSGKYLLFWSNANQYTSAATFVTNNWYHIAVCRASGTVSVYINGNRDGTFSSSTNLSDSNLRIGNNEGASGGITGYLSSVRIVKGTAVYSGTTITVPTAPLTSITNTSILTNFTNAGITDATAKNDLETVGNAQISTTQSKFGGSSMYFDGTGDYLLIPSSPIFALNGDATIEFWLRVPLLPSTYSNLFTINAGAALFIYLNSAGNIGIQTGSAYRDTTTAPISTNTWYHVAITKTSGNTWTVYVNGTSQASSGTGTMGSAISAAIVGIGATSAGANPLNGFIDDLRVSQFARYTANFTPPTAAFPVQ